MQGGAGGIQATPATEQMLQPGIGIEARGLLLQSAR